MLVLLAEEKICGEEWEAKVRSAEGLGGGL